MDLTKEQFEHPLVFVTTGYPVHPCRREDLSRFFRNLKARIGLTKKLTPHIFQHTFCTTLRNNGADISHIKDLAGHADIQTTARYYLGKDKAVLRRVVDSCLDYGLGEPVLLNPDDPAALPLADHLPREGAERKGSQTHT